MYLQMQSHHLPRIFYHNLSVYQNVFCTARNMHALHILILQKFDTKNPTVQSVPIEICQKQINMTEDFSLKALV